jgi:hypothetical protein
MSELILALLDLADAQLRAWRQDGLRLMAALILLAMAGAVAVAGFLLLMLGIYLGIAAHAGHVAAAWATGIIMLLLAGGLAWMGKRAVR